MKTMTTETLRELVSLCSEYDPFVHMIDDYRQEQRVRERNKRATEKFVALVSRYLDGVDRIPYWLINKGRKTEGLMREWLAEKGVKVE